MNLNRNSQTYKKSFYDVFKSMQLSGSYILYYDLDWSKDKVVKFHNNLTKHSNENEQGKFKVNDAINFVRKTGFDCRAKNNKFPYRTKIKMCEVKYSQKDTALVSMAVDDAVGVYLTLASYTLIKDYDFKLPSLLYWYDRLVEFCRLYVNGMKDKHVLKYFDQECDLKITEN